MKSQDENYGYFSKLLQKPFDTLDELKAAEAEFNKKNDAEFRLKEERKADSQAVSDAYANYMKVCKESNKAIQEARDNWIEKREEFIDKYKSYHMTYTNVDGKEEITTNSIIDALFDETLGNFGTLFGRFLK